jgi:hypothetical protein
MYPVNQNFDLYNAQAAAKQAIRDTWFRPYESVQWDRGCGDKACWVYNKTLEGATFLYSGLTSLMDRISGLASSVFSGLDWISNGTFSWTRDGVYPINPINGNRHIMLMPRCAEKFLGNIFYEATTWAMTPTSECLNCTNEQIASKVDGVVDLLVDANGPLLNPENEPTKFDYRAKTVLSNQINAFAVPAGGMVVFSQIVKEIHDAIRSNQIQTTIVRLADGSGVEVDLRAVALNDVLGALMAHEMTHVASRHSIAAMGGILLSALVLEGCRYALIARLKDSDKRYQALSKSSARSEGEVTESAQMEKFYTKVNDSFQYIKDNLGEFMGLFNSRECEYEADVTGTYFALKANLNPLGALYLQEFLKSKSSPWSQFFHKYFEFMYTHPPVEQRKLAVYTAIQSFAPRALDGALQIDAVDLATRCAGQPHRVYTQVNSKV